MKENRMSILNFFIDWKKSPAHWLLLSKFLKPKMIDDFTNDENWKAVLKASPKKFIKTLYKKGILDNAPLEAIMDYKFTISKLKPMLKGYQLKVSGRKAELIKRLILLHYFSRFI